MDIFSEPDDLKNIKRAENLVSYFFGQMRKVSYGNNKYNKNNETDVLALELTKLCIEVALKAGEESE